MPRKKPPRDLVLLPIKARHRTLLMGFTAYLLAYTALFNILGLIGWQALGWFNRIEQLAYLGLTRWWAAAAWRVDGEPMFTVSLAAGHRIRENAISAT